MLEKAGAADGVIKGVMRREVWAEFLDLRRIRILETGVTIS